MCARRFLVVVFIFTLLVVAAGLAIYQWGGNILLKEATPKGHFEAAMAGGGPDYGNLDAWIARPEIVGNPSDWLPEGMTAAGKGEAAVFFVHPTTYFATDRWNAPLLPGGQTEYRTRLFVQSQSSAFNGAGEVWAPRYRQAAYGSFLLKSEDARKALDFAYADVKAAFEEFLNDVPKDRPIILAGHSQGALHLSRLLMEYGARLKGRIAAAYVGGWPLSVTADLPSMGLPPCTRPDETGCILSWQTYGEPANPDFILDQWDDSSGPTGVKRSRKDMLCVNPLTGTTDGAAPANATAGTLVPSANFTSATIANGLTAHCEKGLLILGGQLPQLGNFVLPGNNYHAYDYALFWGAIRADAERRLAAWHR
jgi:pimeloyl-ACP methyl ester carboxylesterase